jgi:single-strand DNA-binding protein
MNKVFLIGNLTKDPESSTIPSGIKVCKFTIAINRTYTGADGTRQVDFFNCIAWRATAENCGKFLKKGSKICVVGSIQNRNYEAQDGTKRYVTEIQADEVQFLSTKSESDSAASDFDEIETLPEVKQSTKKVEKAPVVQDNDDLPF